MQVGLFSAFASIAGPPLLGFRPRFIRTVAAMAPPVIGAVLVAMFGVLGAGLSADDSTTYLTLLACFGILVAGAAVGIQAPGGGRLGVLGALKLVGAYVLTTLLLVGVLLGLGLLAASP